MPAAQSKIIGYQGPRRTILIADDEEPNLALLQQLLEPLGFSVIQAHDGRDAVAKARDTTPDLIVMDLIMPVMTGFQAVKRIHRIATLRDVPIIAMSASTLERDRIQARSVGCTEFLAKPITLDKLLRALQSYLTLSWEYAESEPSNQSVPAVQIAAKTQPNELQDEGLIPPPREELEVCYRLAKLGSLRKLRERAAHLRGLDDRYGPFADKLEQLCKGFRDEALLSLIEQYYER